MAKPTKKAAKPIEDVAKPGKSAPAGTSKAVIVTNRPMIEDPMMVGKPTDTGQEIPAVKPPSLTPPKHPRLEPLSAPLLPGISESAVTDDVTPAKPKTQAPLVSEIVAKHKKAAKAALVPKPEPKPAPVTAELPSPTPTPIPPTTQQVDGPNPIADPVVDEAVQEAEQEAALQKIVDSKQYFLPINAIEKRRTKRVIIGGILLSIVLLLAWVNIALDAGLIQIGDIKPVTHFFSS